MPKPQVYYNICAIPIGRIWWPDYDITVTTLPTNNICMLQSGMALICVWSVDQTKKPHNSIKFIAIQLRNVCKCFNKKPDLSQNKREWIYAGLRPILL